jgi:hypothetical protein
VGIGDSMFLETFFQIVRTREFVIILIIMIILFPMIFAIASRSKKSVSIKKMPKVRVATEKKSLKTVPATQMI